MDLKIKDVSELLNVSETTIRRWLADEKIPAYRINHQYRFNRLEIEDWVMSQKIGKSSGGNIPFIGAANSFSINQPNSSHQSSSNNLLKSDTVTNNLSGGSKQFSLFRAIHKGGVLHNIPGTNKKEIIRNAMKQIAAYQDLDAEVISDLLLDREALQSTGLNNGIAIPHTRDFLLDAHLDMVYVVFPENPTPYDALDSKPVHTLFFLFASDDKRHLHLLAKIAHLSSQPATLALLETKPSKEVLLDYIKDWESTIQQNNTSKSAENS